MTWLEIILTAAVAIGYSAGCMLMFLSNRLIDEGNGLRGWHEVLLVGAWPVAAVLGMRLYIFDPEMKADRRERAARVAKSGPTSITGTYTTLPWAPTPNPRIPDLTPDPTYIESLIEKALKERLAGEDELRRLVSEPKEMRKLTMWKAKE